MACCGQIGRMEGHDVWQGGLVVNAQGNGFVASDTPTCQAVFSLLMQRSHVFISYIQLISLGPMFFLPTDLFMVAEQDVVA